MKLKNISKHFSQSRRQQRVSRLLSNRIGNAVMNEGSMVPWSDLPSDILHCVASRLGLVDQIRFRAVCKSWCKIKDIKPNDKLPWIFVLNESRFNVINDKTREPHYYLYDLHHQKLYGVSIQRWSTRMRLWRFESMEIMCIKLGWLLVNRFFYNSFLLFNIFTQTIIALPKVFKYHVWPLSTFRYCPKSKRLVVYATNRDVSSRVVIIRRWKSGDRKWESRNFAAEFPSFMKNIIKIEVVGEALYCVFETGVVGCFNERHKSWSVVVKYSEDDKLFSTVKDSFYAFEFRGELLMMDFQCYSKCNLWRLDQSKGRWVEVVQFHKCAIFCSEYNHFSFLCSEKFVVASDPVDTRIYYFTFPCSGVSTKDYNHVHPKSDDFDPFRIMNIKFPWCYGRHPYISYPFHWIEPRPFYPMNSN